MTSQMMEKKINELIDSIAMWPTLHQPIIKMSIYINQ